MPLRSLFALGRGVAALTLATAIAGGQTTDSGERIRYVRVIAKDYAFDAPLTASEGIVTFHLVNQGGDVHHLQLLELGVGHSLKEFFDALRTKGTPPAWAVTVGATPIIQKNTEAFLTLRVAAGKYILSCLIPARDGRSHVEKGMYQLLTVSPVPATKTAPDPKAAVKKKP